MSCTNLCFEINKMHLVPLYNLAYIALEVQLLLCTSIYMYMRTDSVKDCKR